MKWNHFSRSSAAGSTYYRDSLYFYCKCHSRRILACFFYYSHGERERASLGAKRPDIRVDNRAVFTQLFNRFHNQRERERGIGNKIYLGNKFTHTHTKLKGVYSNYR